MERLDELLQAYESAVAYAIRLIRTGPPIPLTEADLRGDAVRRVLRQLSLEDTRGVHSGMPLSLKFRAALRESRYDAGKRAGNRQVILETEVLEESANERGRASASALDEAGRNETAGLVIELLAKLDEHERVLLRHFLEDIPWLQIAEELAITEGAARKRGDRLKELLRTRWRRLFAF